MLFSDDRKSLFNFRLINYIKYKTVKCKHCTYTTRRRVPSHFFSYDIRILPTFSYFYVIRNSENMCLKNKIILIYLYG